MSINTLFALRRHVCVCVHKEQPVMLSHDRTDDICMVSFDIFKEMNQILISIIRSRFVVIVKCLAFMMDSHKERCAKIELRQIYIIYMHCTQTKEIPQCHFAHSCIYFDLVATVSNQIMSDLLSIGADICFCCHNKHQTTSS